MFKNEIIKNNDIESVGVFDVELKKAALKNNFTFVSKKDLFPILNFKNINRNKLIFYGEPLTYDTNHLSYGACKHISDKIIDINIFKE